MPLPLLIFLLALYPTLGYITVVMWSGLLYAVVYQKPAEDRHSVLQFWSIKTHIGIVLWPIFAVAVFAVHLSAWLHLGRIKENKEF